MKAYPRGWMHETGAQGWCTGMTQRDGMGREVGGGFRWGTHANTWLIHVNVWQKPLQYCKVISFQLIRNKGKKKAYPGNTDLVMPTIVIASRSQAAQTASQWPRMVQWKKY